MLNLYPVEEEFHAELNRYPVLYWNHVGLEMNRITHSLGGPQGGPTMSSRALGLLHLAMHDAFFGWLGNTSYPSPYLPTTPPTLPVPPAGSKDLISANDALTGAAITVLDKLYSNAAGAGISIVARDTLTGMLSKMIADFAPAIDVLGPAHGYGVKVAGIILDMLSVKPGEPGADAGRYEPKQARSFFNDEPVNPVRDVPLDPNDPARGHRSRRVYHGPFYGQVQSIAVHDPEGHRLAPPPFDEVRDVGGVVAPADKAEYIKALDEVQALGGAAHLATTKRTPDQTVAGLYWAYDGPNLIGTPPRLYNQILRNIAWGKRNAAATATESNTVDFVRLFALANVAMADAGKFSWKEKFRFELWRPLSGVRQHGVDATPIDPHCDPFWLSLGAPDTNSNRMSFKPPFPAYPSGHATFGAACFQMARLFYNRGNPAFKPGDDAFDPNAVDSLGFKFVSEELNGICRDLRGEYDATLPIVDQVGTVRTRIHRSFPSLWAAIFENAFSRVYLGVHWRFDAAAAKDIKKPDGTNKDPADIKYSSVWTGPRSSGDALPTGGVPLGLGIANDIWLNGMKAPPGAATVASSSAKHSAPGECAVKLTNTTYN